MRIFLVRYKVISVVRTVNETDTHSLIAETDYTDFLPCANWPSTLQMLGADILAAYYAES